MPDPEYELWLQQNHPAKRKKPGEETPPLGQTVLKERYILTLVTLLWQYTHTHTYTHKYGCLMFKVLCRHRPATSQQGGYTGPCSVTCFSLAVTSNNSVITVYNSAVSGYRTTVIDYSPAITGYSPYVTGLGACCNWFSLCHTWLVLSIYPATLALL